jgi:hypothetical protein
LRQLIQERNVSRHTKNIANNKSAVYQQRQTFRQLIKVEYALKHADFYATDRNENARRQANFQSGDENP